MSPRAPSSIYEANPCMTLVVGASSIFEKTEHPTTSSADQAAKISESASNADASKSHSAPEDRGRTSSSADHPMDITMRRNNDDDVRMIDATATKSVRWSSKTSFCVIDNKVNKANNDDCKYIWYNKKELMRLREECEIAKIFARKGVSSVNYSCRWGLEHTICENHAFIRCNRKREALDAVIEEQQAQREEGDYSPEFIAELYQDITSESRREAHQLALQYHGELQHGDTCTHTTTDADTTATTKMRPGRMSNYRKNIRKKLHSSLFVMSDVRRLGVFEKTHL